MMTTIPIAAYTQYSVFKKSRTILATIAQRKMLMYHFWYSGMYFLDNLPGSEKKSTAGISNRSAVIGASVRIKIGTNGPNILREGWYSLPFNLFKSAVLSVIFCLIFRYLVEKESRDGRTCLKGQKSKPTKWSTRYTQIVN